MPLLWAVRIWRTGIVLFQAFVRTVCTQDLVGRWVGRLSPWLHVRPVLRCGSRHPCDLRQPLVDALNLSAAHLGRQEAGGPCPHLSWDRCPHLSTSIYLSRRSYAGFALLPELTHVDVFIDLAAPFFLLQ